MKSKENEKKATGNLISRVEHMEVILSGSTGGKVPQHLDREKCDPDRGQWETRTPKSPSWCSSSHFQKIFL